ncbi:protein kinase [Apiospora saccharicola]|uniref:EKC/KEOPS complex subunit BUD32 n=1 Tax=Apiospora saccharicola TaxID=335842 RepID=A0ABR1UH53_9PEZI
MAEPQNTPVPEGVPTVKNFSDISYPRYYKGRDNWDLYHTENGLENPEYYQPGGFCPIDLSFPSSPSFINERFEVIYKLGYGGFGTVWLCYEEAVKKWRAVKVGASEEMEEHRGEPLVESMMKQHSVGLAEALENNIVLPLETFWIESINGRHLCTVLPLLGPRLSDWLDAFEPDDPEQAQRIATQMVEGMDFLHRHGICHGDFRPQNILMQLKDDSLDEIGIDEMCELLEAPRMVDILLRRNGSPCPHAPKQSYTGVRWGLKGLQRFVSDKIAIVDFGQAYPTTNPNPGDMGIPGDYAAPEIVLGGPKGTGTDIWALARTIMDFRTRTMFSFSGDTSRNVREMELVAGPCQPPFRAEVQKRVSVEDENSKGYCLYDDSYVRKDGRFDNPLDEYLGTEHVNFLLSRDEALSISDLLRNLFRWQPEERWHADKILSHRWFAEHHQPAQLLNPNRDLRGKPETQPSPGEERIENDTSGNQAVQEGETALSEEIGINVQPTKPWRKAAWLYLGVLTMAFYLSGVIAMVSFFLAHMLANQPGFYANRPGRGISSNGATGQLSPVIQHAVITFTLQA